ncbi:hypothetical protein D3C80_964860 [compost metagenome]
MTDLPPDAGTRLVAGRIVTVAPEIGDADADGQVILVFVHVEPHAIQDDVLSGVHDARQARRPVMAVEDRHRPIRDWAGETGVMVGRTPAPHGAADLVQHNIQLGVDAAQIGDDGGELIRGGLAAHLGVQLVLAADQILQPGVGDVDRIVLDHFAGAVDDHAGPAFHGLNDLRLAADQLPPSADFAIQPPELVLQRVIVLRLGIQPQSFGADLAIQPSELVLQRTVVLRLGIELRRLLGATIGFLLLQIVLQRAVELRLGIELPLCLRRRRLGPLGFHPPGLALHDLPPLDPVAVMTGRDHPEIQLGSRIIACVDKRLSQIEVLRGCGRGSDDRGGAQQRGRSA